VPDDSAAPTQEDGMISVVVSPMQLAAVLENQTISEGETVTNRIWGAVGTIGGMLEVLGSAALLVDPDPTVSKVVGAVGIVHGTDVTLTSWRELISGRDQKTLTAQAATALAARLGLDPQSSAMVGVAVDIAVPTGVAAAVARSMALARLGSVAGVRAGFVSLAEEERLFTFANKPSASAHALRDHVGKSLSDMLARFTAKPSLEATASFRTIPEAEAAVSQVLRANKAAIQSWASSSATKPLRLTMKFATDIGEGVLNPAKNAVTPGAVYGSLKIKTVTVVLARTTLNGRTWYVLTAFPDIMRDLGLIP
jgi:hypothetical protein